MNEKELGDLALSVDKWNDETYPRLSALDDAWKDADVKDYDEGLKLASALRKARDFVSQAYAFDASKRVRILHEFLVEIRNHTALKNIATRSSGDKTRYMSIEPRKKNQEISDSGEPLKDSKETAKEIVPKEKVGKLQDMMPFLTPELQQEAKGIHTEYLKLTKYRQQLESLSENAKSSKEDIAAISQMVVHTSDKIQNFWDRAKLQYAKSTGQEIEKGLEDKIETESGTLSAVEKRKDGEYTLEEIEAMESKEDRERIKKARVEANKKYLRRVDVAANAERKEELRLRVGEMLKWGYKITPKQQDVCMKAGLTKKDLGL